MVQPVHHPAAQVQPDAGGLLILPAVVAGEALLEHPGQVLRPDADAVVGNHHRLPVAVDADAPSGGGVFQGIGQHLLHHEGEPLLVRQHRPVRLLEVQGDLFQNEHPGELPHRLPQQAVQVRVPEHVVRALAVQPEIAQHHVHILLDLQELHFHLGTHGAGVLLQEQPGRGDGGLDLVGPEGVVVRHVLQPVPVLRRQTHPVGADRTQQGLVVRLQRAPGRRQGQHRLMDLPEKAFQFPVPPEKGGVPQGEQDQPQHQAEEPGVGHRLHRQIVQGEHGGEHRHRPGQQQQQLPLALQVGRQHMLTPPPDTRRPSGCG